MKKKMKNYREHRRKSKMYSDENFAISGITLIALVITIIILLILAGVSLSLVTGSDGILSKAEKAEEVTNDSAIKEEVEMAIAEYALEYYSGASAEAVGKTFQEYVADKLNGYETASGGLIISDEDGNLTYTDKKGNTTILEMDSNGVVEITGKVTAGGDFVDTAVPRVKVDLTTTNSITFTLTDNVGVVGYAITESNTQPTEWVSIDASQKYTTTVSGKNAEKTYYVWAKDEAGNVSNSAKAVTGAVDAASNSNITYTTTWERK